MKSHPALGQLELKQYPVEYIDVRIEDSLETSISFVNGEQLQCQELPSLGAFLRVYHNGRWHELATTKINSLNNEVELLVKRALACEAGSGGKVIGRLPQITLRGNVRDYLGEDFIGVAKDRTASGRQRPLLTRLNVLLN